MTPLLCDRDLTYCLWYRAAGSGADVDVQRQGDVHVRRLYEGKADGG